MNPLRWEIPGLRHEPRHPGHEPWRKAGPFEHQEGAELYMRRRYRMGPQLVLNWREQAIVRSAIGWLVKTRRVTSPGRLLDVPSGYGRLLGRVCVDPLVPFGVDLASAQARLTLSRAPAVTGNLLQGLPFADRTFDVVICARFLHHIHDGEVRLGVLRELWRVTRCWALISFYHLLRVWSALRALLELRARQWGHNQVLDDLRRKLWMRGSPKSHVGVVPHEQLAAEALNAGLAIEREWRVLPGIHPHRFVLLRRSG